MHALARERAVTRTVVRRWLVVSGVVAVVLGEPLTGLGEVWLDRQRTRFGTAVYGDGAVPGYLRRPLLPPPALRS
jgi:hypothetical protein